MAWCQTGDKPISEPTMASFDDAYKRLSASMCYNEMLSEAVLLLTYNDNIGRL